MKLIRLLSVVLLFSLLPAKTVEAQKDDCPTCPGGKIPDGPVLRTNLSQLCFGEARVSLEWPLPRKGCFVMAGLSGISQGIKGLMNDHSPFTRGMKISGGFMRWFLPSLRLETSLFYKYEYDSEIHLCEGIYDQYSYGLGGSETWSSGTRTKHVVGVLVLMESPIVMGERCFISIYAGVGGRYRVCDFEPFDSNAYGSASIESQYGDVEEWKGTVHMGLNFGFKF